MKINKEAAQQLLDELTKSKVLVTFSGKFYEGYPTWDPFNQDVYEIEKVETKIIQGLIFRKYFKRFSITINDKFNSLKKFPFYADPNYRPHMESLSNEVISEIDHNINLRIGKWDIFDYLTNLEFELNEIKNNFILQESQVFNENQVIKQEVHIEMDDRPIYFNKNVKIEIKGLNDFIPDVQIYSNFSLSRYWDIQIDVIEKLLRIIKTRIIIIEKTDDYVKEINSLSPLSLVQWKKSDTDLLELIVALNESGSIFCNNSAMSRKQTIEFFENLFGISIKDSESKLSRATERKKDPAPYITFLRQTFINYSERKLR